MAGIGVARKAGNCRTPKSRTVRASAFEITHDTLSGFPVHVIVAIEELAQVLHGKGNVGTSADSEIH